MTRGRHRAAGARERGQQRHVAGKLIFGGRSDFAQHENALTAVGLDPDRHLRISQVAVGELLLELLLQGREA